jgi:hypothetical protein
MAGRSDTDILTGEDMLRQYQKDWRSKETDPKTRLAIGKEITRLKESSSLGRYSLVSDQATAAVLDQIDKICGVV